MKIDDLDPSDIELLEESQTPAKLSIDDLAEEDIETVNQEEISGFGSVSRGVAQGLTFGFADEISGAIESTFTDKTYEEARDESRANFAIAKEVNPTAFLTGEVAGGIVQGIVAGPGSLLAKAAGAGALQALGESEEDKLEEQLEDALFGAVVGGAFDRLTFGAGKAFGKAKNALGKQAKKFSAPVALKGIGIKNRSTMKKLQKKLDAKGETVEGFLERFESQVGSDGTPLVKATMTQDALNDALKDRKSTLGDEMGLILKSIDVENGGSVAIQPSELADHLELEIIEPLMAAGTFDAEQVAKQVQKRAAHLRESKGTMSMMDLHNFKVKTQSKVNFLKKQNTDLELNAQLKKMVGSTNEFIHDKVRVHSSDPATLGLFKETKKNFGNLADAEEFLEASVMDAKDGLVGNVRNVLSNIAFNGGLTVMGGFAGGLPGAAIGATLTAAGKNPKISRQLGKSLSVVGDYLTKNPTNERYYQMLASASLRGTDALNEAIASIESNLNGNIIDEQEKQDYISHIKSSRYSTKSKMSLLQQVNNGKVPNMGSAEQEQPFVREPVRRPRNENGRKI